MNTLHLAQIISSVLLIVLILIQERSSGLSGILGGGGGDGGSYQTRRGLERVLFWATIGMGAIFAILVILDLVLPNAL